MSIAIDTLRSAAREIVGLLVDGNYEAVIQCTKSRLTSEDLRAVIRNYERELVPLPSNAYHLLDAVQVKDAPIPTWSVRVPLWTREEGRSDLTLELTIALGSAEPRVELDELHVL